MTRYNLKRHGQRHGPLSDGHDIPEHACDECQKTFKSEQALLYHVKMLHASSPAEYSCFQCDYKTKFQNNLNRHFQKHLPGSERQDKQILSCKYCQKLFQSSSGLASHVKGKHDKVFKYSCDTCHKGYNIRRQFQLHLASHSKVTYLECNLCEAKFRFKSGLFRHVHVDHQQDTIEWTDDKNVKE